MCFRVWHVGGCTFCGFGIGTLDCQGWEAACGMDGSNREGRGTDWQNSTFLSSTHFGPAPEIFFFLSRRGGWQAMLCWSSLHCAGISSSESSLLPTWRRPGHPQTPHAARCRCGSKGRGGAGYTCKGQEEAMVPWSRHFSHSDDLDVLLQMHSSQTLWIPSFPLPQPAKRARGPAATWHRSMFWRRASIQSPAQMGKPRHSMLEWAGFVNISGHQPSLDCPPSRLSTNRMGIF